MFFTYIFNLSQQLYSFKCTSNTFLFIPKYFLPFNAILSGILFLNFTFS